MSAEFDLVDIWCIRTQQLHVLLGDSDPNTKNWEKLESFQTEYDSMYDYITQGANIRSQATWYKFSERNNKYFLNLKKLQ